MLRALYGPTKAEKTSRIPSKFVLSFWGNTTASLDLFLDEH